MESNNLLYGYLLADRAKKNIQTQGGVVPKNFNTKYGLLASIPNVHPAMTAILVQDEMQKAVPTLSPQAQARIEAQKQNLRKTVASMAKVDLSEEVEKIFLASLDSEQQSYYGEIKIAQVEGKEETSPSVSYQLYRDKLTKIDEISQSIELQLNQIGVFTYKDLLTSDLSKLEESLGAEKSEAVKATAQRIITAIDQAIKAPAGPAQNAEQ